MGTPYTQLYGNAAGLTNNVAPQWIKETRDPNQYDVNYLLFQVWVNQTDETVWYLSSFSSNTGVILADWIQFDTSVSSFETLTGDTGVATESAGNINVYGTTSDAGSGIETEGSGDTLSVRMHTPFSLSDFEFTTSTSGATRTVSITNSSDTASSDAREIISVAGTSAGDPYQVFSVGSTQSYSIGIDNTDSDIFKITQAAASTVTPSTGATVQQFDTSNQRVLFPLQGLALASSFSGGNVNLLVQNINTTASSDATLSLQVSALLGGNSYVNYTGPTNNWSHGVDKGDSNKWKLTQGVVGEFPLSVVAMIATIAGDVTFPHTVEFQEGFIVHRTAVASSPYVVLGTDYYLSVDTSVAITIQLPDAPTTGRTFVIKDATGNAAANNISVTTVGGVVNIDGAATYPMNVNYQSIQLLFNGTSYEIF